MMFSTSRSGKRARISLLELVDLARRDLLEIGGQGVAGVELLAVDQQRARAAQPLPVSSTLRKAARLPSIECAAAVLVRRARNRQSSRRPAWRWLVLLQTTMKTGGVANAGRLPLRRTSCS